MNDLQAIKMIELLTKIEKHLRPEAVATKRFKPPSLGDVMVYFKEKGYSTDAAKTAFNHYNVADWKDARGNMVKNWKQKMNTVWFKEENKEKDKIVYDKL